MSLTHLSRRTNSLAAAVAMSAEEIEVENNELRSEEVSKTELRADMESNSQAMDKVLSALDVVSGLKENDVPNNIVAAVFGEHLSAAGIPEDVASEKAVGCESAGDDLGNEAMQTAKDIIMDIVNWFLGQWKKLKDLIKRTIAKNFGSVKRSSENMRKLKVKIEKYQDEGYTREDKSALEIKSGAAYLVLGATENTNPKTAADIADITGKVEEFRKVIAECQDIASTTEGVPEWSGLDDCDLTADALKGQMTYDAFGGVNLGDFKVSTDNRNHSKGVPLMGRKVLHSLAKNDLSATGDIKDTEEKLREAKKYVNGCEFKIRPSNTELKTLDEVKFKCSTLDELLALVEAHIDLCTETLTLETSKKIIKLEKAFDKAMAGAKKWVNDADKDNAADKRKAVAATGFMSTYLGTRSEMTLGLIDDSISHVSSQAKAHGSTIVKVLGRYKKKVD